MSANSISDLLSDVAQYYSEKIAEHGDQPKGVDWNGKEGQELRFQQLCKIITKSQCSINDLGCGYGALFDYLSTEFEGFSYRGFDISDSMVQAAKVRYDGKPNAAFQMTSTPDQIADYGIASGIFNVRLGRSDSEWKAYLESTLDLLDQSSRNGFSFNCLTSYSDKEKMRDYLYYANPGELFDLCKQRYSRNVSLLHDYDLYEFTILVRKTL